MICPLSTQFFQRRRYKNLNPQRKKLQKLLTEWLFRHFQSSAEQMTTVFTKSSQKSRSSLKNQFWILAPKGLPWDRCLLEALLKIYFWDEVGFAGALDPWFWRERNENTRTKSYFQSPPKPYFLVSWVFVRCILFRLLFAWENLFSRLLDYFPEFDPTINRVYP